MGREEPGGGVRLQLARDGDAALAEEHRLPLENLLTPDTLRRVLWEPPATREPGELLDHVVAALQEHGARSWQIGLTAPVVVTAVLEADAKVAADAAAAAQAAADGADAEPGQPEEPSDPSD